MGLTFWLYITDFFSNINDFCGITWFVYIFVLGLFMVVWGTSDDDETMELMSKFIKKMLRFSWIPILFIFISVFIPSQRTMYLMIGSTYLSKSDLPSKVSQVLELKLDDIIADMNKPHKSSGNK
jgi:hypothetical protein